LIESKETVIEGVGDFLSGSSIHGELNSLGFAVSLLLYDVMELKMLVSSSSSCYGALSVAPTRARASLARARCLYQVAVDTA
jgi:hypothetical protein